MQVLALRVLATLSLACVSLLGSPAAHAAPFAVTGPCYLLPSRNEAAEPDSFDGAASGFVGDRDGDGVRDRAIHLFPDRPGNDVPGEYHFLVMRGTCGHWVGGFVSMQPEQLEVGDKPVQGLGPVIATSRVSGGDEATQYHFTGQGFYPALKPGCRATGWRPGPGRSPHRQADDRGGTGCIERVDGSVIIRSCEGVQFFFSKPKGTLTRIEFPASSPASPAKK